jgi:hypothetical protein
MPDAMRVVAPPAVPEEAGLEAHAGVLLASSGTIPAACRSTASGQDMPSP